MIDPTANRAPADESAAEATARFFLPGRTTWREAGFGSAFLTGFGTVALLVFIGLRLRRLARH